LIWHSSVNILDWLFCKLFGSLLIVLSLNWMNQNYHHSNDMIWMVNFLWRLPFIPNSAAIWYIFAIYVGLKPTQIIK
jgi:hypothetical protein